MKRAFSLLISVFIILSAVPVLAADVDLSGKSVEELLEIRQVVDQALLEQNGCVTIQAGLYEAGKDIAPGSYNITFYLLPGEETPAGMYYRIWKTPDSKSEYDSAVNTYISDKRKARVAEEAGEPFEYPDDVDGALYATDSQRLAEAGGSIHISLQEGNVLELSGWCNQVIGLIEKSAGLFME